MEIKKYGYIYKTIDLKTGKIYIGQHKNNVFDKDYHGSGIIIKNIKRKRPMDLITELIEYCDTLDILNEREIYWIEYYHSCDDKIGYNIAKGGCGRLGVVFSEETKKHLSKINKGKILSEETRKKISESNKCKNKGKHLSDETKRKLSESKKGKYIGELNPFFGKSHTKETKEKIGNANKLHSHTTESKQKISESLKGRKFTEEHKQKISDACKGRNKGKPLSEETRKKISDACKKEKNGFYGKQHSEETRKKISEARTGKKLIKYKWLTANGTIKEMTEYQVKRHHPDWIRIYA